MKKIAGLFLVFGVLSASFAEDMAPLALSSTRSLGMGGAHVAYTDDVYALFVNPAALQRANQGSGFELSPAFVGPFFDLLDLAGSAGDDLTGSLGDFAKETGGKIPLGIDLRGPLSIGYTANGLGFGLWNRVHLDAAVIGTDIDASVLVDLILNYGMSFSVLSLENHEVDAGFVVKPFLRAKAGMAVTALDAIGGGLDNMFDEFNVPLIAGAGFDLGFMYRFHEDLSVGMTIDDVYTGGSRISTLYGDDDGVSSYRIPATLNLGVAYTLRPIPLLGLAFMLDYRDVTNLFQADDYTRRNPILNLAFGTELSILQFLKLRVGLNEMLPAAGAGFVAKAFQFNVAIYGREMSNEPGGFSAYGLDLSIAIRPETKKKSWPWSRPILNSLLGMPAPDTSSAAAEAAAAASFRELDAAVTRLSFKD
ncbi:MAG: hypothetical protein LBK63_01200 [Treponema sp.]|jgi:hypothetical protein|nr:hypothetical protein [Treponema sp.]